MKIGRPVEKQHQVQAVLVAGAVPHLPRHREEARRIEPPRLLIQPARRPKPSEPEGAAHVLHAAPKHIERTPALDVGCQPPQKPLLHLSAMVLRQSPPLLRLRGQHEVHHVVRQQAQLAVVVLRPPPVVATRPHPVVPERLRTLPYLCRVGHYFIGTAPQ